MKSIGAKLRLAKGRFCPLAITVSGDNSGLCAGGDKKARASAG